ncbi:MAG: FixH family protein [Deltaproteobacteria bacterium]|nr:FixH family protein [Nannocystaceae bacterium]
MLVRNIGVAGLVAISLAMWGCDDADSDDDDGGHDHHAEAGCAGEERDDVYMLGMEKSGTALTVRFVDAMPAPPARYENTWTLEVLDASGAPVDDATLEVEPFMPDHNHGTGIAAVVTKLEAPGQLEIEPIDLFMPGLWEVRLRFTLADQTRDDITFSFCVDP